MKKNLILALFLIIAAFLPNQEALAFAGEANVQTGELSLSSRWTTVVFSEPFSSTPVVFIQKQTQNGTQFAQAELFNVTTTGFSVRLEEDRGPLKLWLDGSHIAETARWIAIDQTSVVSGLGIEVGTVLIGQKTPSAQSTINFTESFSDAPLIFTQIQTSKNSQTVRTDLLSVSSTQAILRLEEDPGSRTRGWDGIHPTEEVAYLAVDSAVDFSDNGLLTGSQSVDEQWVLVCYLSDCSTAFTSAPTVFVEIQTENENDTVQTEIRNITTEGFSVQLTELTRAGWDDIHVDETVAWSAYGTIYEETYDPAAYQIALVETSSSGVSFIETALVAEGYSVTRVINSDLISGAASLSGFDTLIMPGGSDPVYDAMDTNLQTVVQNFVSAGGGYVGICGGAIAGSDTVTLLDYYSVTLDMLGIGAGVNSIYNTGWTSYIGSSSPWLELEVSTDHAIFDGLYSAGDIATLRYYGGPVFSVSSSATVLATYYQNFDSSYSVIGSPAIVESSFGSGTVILFALHPEYDSLTQPLLLNAVQYVNHGF